MTTENIIDKKRMGSVLNMNVYMPTRLFTGRDCVKNHADQFGKLGKKCLIMTGKNGAKACGALDDVTAALDSQNIIWEQFDGIGQNPKLTDCMTAAEKAIAMGAEFIIGIGGGSPLDAAKCASVLAANEGMTQTELYSLKWPQKPLPCAAVGTTAGTGSEVTKVSVITIPEGLKKSFHHEDVFPAVSFGDPKYTQTLPDIFTRSTAIDALAHCVESYFTRQANEISQCYSIRGIRIIMEQFKKMLADPEGELSFEDREALYNASIYGGLAINVTGTCMPHAMGYMLSEQHGVPHGTACAKYLPAFHEHNKRVIPELTARFLDEIGCDEETYLRIIRAVTPDFPVEMTPQDVADAHFRWIGNGSIAKSWGEITPEMCDQILTELFVK